MLVLPSHATASSCFQRLLPPNFISDSATFLRSCISARALSQGKLGHDLIIRHSHDRNPYLGNLLLQLYGHCAALYDASKLFASSQQPHDRFAWRSIICAHAKHGSLAEAIHFFGLMCLDGALPEKIVLVNILSACSAEGALLYGKLVHSYIARCSFNEDVIVGTALIHMHGKCGSLTDARCVFNKLRDRDTIAWNAMIAVYAQQSEECKHGAFQIFVQMRQEGALADSATFVNAFSLFFSKGDLPEGKRLHAVVNETGLDEDLMVATAILNMYSKCSNLEDTQKMFDRVHAHDKVSWNTMIGAYAEDGQTGKALQLFEQMQREGLKPDKVSFLSILEAFSNEEALAEGKNMHACITHSGCELDVAVGTALINMYGRCGSPDDAQIMFDKMPERNAFTWNSLIAAYAQNAQGDRAIQQLKKMKEDGLQPDRFTLLSIVDACTDVSEAEEIHSCMTNTGLDLDDATGKALIHMYSNCGSLWNCWSVFNKFPEQTLVIWNAMIAALAENREGTKALQLFHQIQLQGLLPNKISFISVFDAYKNNGTLKAGKRMHASVKVANLDTDVAVGTALVNMYVRCGSLNDAWDVFENMCKRDVISWTALITACCQLGKCSEAFELFERMQKEGFQPDKVAFISILSACNNPTTLTQGKHIHTLIVQSRHDSNVIVANALLNMYCRCGCLDDALSIFERISLCNSITYASILSACANWAALSEGKQIHASIMGTETETNVIVGNALINLYGKCGSLEDSQMMFDKMQHRDAVTWTVLVAAYAQQGKGRVALQLFNWMQLEGAKPDEITFVNVLLACCHDGLLHEACHNFLSMNSVYGIVPLVDHYDCLIDLFARAGRLEEAENLIREMPFPATAVSWTSFLSACKGLADVKRGEWAAEHVSHLEPKNSAPYVILLNIYNAAGRIDDSAIAFHQAENLLWASL
eukprot:c19346_g1_i1 orf=1433-4231(-)